MPAHLFTRDQRAELIQHATDALDYLAWDYSSAHGLTLEQLFNACEDDGATVYWGGNMWVSPHNGQQHATIGGAVRSELEFAIRAGGDPEDCEAEILAAIDEAAESGGESLEDYESLSD